MKKYVDHAIRALKHSSRTLFVASQVPLVALAYAICAALVVAACNDRTSNVPPLRTATEVRDSAGVTIIHSSDTTGVFVDTATTLTIGFEDGPEHLTFFRISNVDTDARGNIYVLDAGEATVRVYSVDGQYQRSMGGFGSGPGEFREPMAMIVSADTVAVWDFQLRRLTMFRSDGEVLATTNPTVPATGRGWMYPVARVQSGWLTVRLDYQPDPKPGSFREDSMEIARVAGELLEGPLQQTILRFPYTRFYPVDIESGTFNVTPLAHRGGDFAISREGHTYIPEQGAYAVQIFDQSGNLLRRVTRAHTPVALTAGLIDRYSAAVREYLGTTGGSRAGERAALLAQTDVPHSPYFPPIGRILVAPDRTMWLERIDVADDPLDLLWSGSPIARLTSGLWDAFDADGRFLATINLGSRFSPMKAENGSLLGILRTEAGVHRVARVRVDFDLR